MPILASTRTRRSTVASPGSVLILGARVLGEFGDDPHRYTSAKARKNYAGSSPITRASGTTRVSSRGAGRGRRRPDRRKGDLAPPGICTAGAPASYRRPRGPGCRHLRRHLSPRRQPARATAPQGRPGTRLRLPVPLPHRRLRGRHPGRTRRAGSRPGHRARGPHRRPAGAHPPPGRADLRHAARPHRGHPALRRHRRRRRRGAPRLRRAGPRRLGRRRRDRDDHPAR